MCNTGLKNYVPIRMCKVCRKKVSKNLLSRYVKINSNDTYATFGNMILDKEKNMAGRGFYVCNNSECQEKFQKLRLKK